MRIENPQNKRLPFVKKTLRMMTIYFQPHKKITEENIAQEPTLHLLKILAKSITDKYKIK